MKTPTTVLLVVIAALLAANLFVNLPAQEATAQAQPPPFPPPVDDSPRPVGIAATHWKTTSGINTHFVYRVWSDGRVERNRRNHTGPWLGWETVPE